MKSLIKFSNLFLIAGLLAALVAIPPTRIVHAAGIVVDTGGDLALAGNGRCSLREAITNANTDSDTTAGDCAAGSGADTITFAADYTITLNDQLPAVTSIITINGNGAANTIIEADASPNVSNYRIFVVQAGGDLTLDRLKARNGFCNGLCATAPKDGGAINNAGVLVITNSTLSDNSVDNGGGFGGNGGAIFNSGTLIITDSTLSGNSAGVPGAIFGGDGGGIYSDGAALTITNCTFSDNYAGDGGAVESHDDVMTITRSTLFHNSEGALVTWADTATITDSTFSDNSGEGIISHANLLTITGSTIFHNTGGGLHNLGPVATITDSLFQLNVYQASGAAIYSVGSALTITDTTFIENAAGGNGGAINNYLGPVTITGSRFISNFAHDGGAIYNSGASGVIITDSSLSDNSAFNGGGIFNTGSSLVITDSTLSGNSAAPDVDGFGGDAGAIYNNDASALSINNSTLSGNSALYGGGIFNRDSSVTITNSTLSGNSAVLDPWFGFGGDGGGIYNSGLDASLYNTIIADSPSGGDCFIASGTLTADSFNLDTDGSCDNALQKTSAEINLDLLADNGGFAQTAGLLAGSHAIDAGDDSVCAASPVNNLDQRGLTRPQGSHCDVGAFESNAQAVPDLVVNVNNDTDDGFCDGLAAGITDCSLREAINTANTFSGADSITFSANFTITLNDQLPVVSSQVTIIGNGAANTIIRAAANPVIADYRVLEVGNVGNLTLESLAVKNGQCDGACATAPSDGGGILVDSGGTLTILDSTLSDNNVANRGAGIENNGTLTITDTLLSDNSAGAYGGGIDNNGSLTIMGSTLAGNTADFRGAGIYNDDALIVVNSTLTGGSAIYGGALYNNSGSLTVTNSTLASNGAPFGGGIYVAAPTTLINTIVANSSADCYIDGGSITADSYNLDNDGTCANATQKTSAELNLDAVAENGGATPTIGLLPGSHAIDAGDDAVCASAAVSNLDQRGVPRPQDGDGNGVAACDVGAYELQSTTTTITSDAPDPSQVNTAFTVDVTVASVFSTPTGTVTVSDGTNNCVITLSNGSGSCPFTSTISGPKTLTATYPGDANFGGSSSIETHTVYNVLSSFQSAGANDGSILELNETSNTGGTLNSTANTLRVGDEVGDIQYRSILDFDTASLPANAIILKVDLQVRRQGVEGSDPSSLGNLVVDIHMPWFSNNAALQLQDFQAAASMLKAARIMGPPDASDWLTTTLDPAAHAFVNLAGSTQFRLRFTLDDNDDNSADFVRFHSGDADAASRPVLLVYYYTVP